MQCARRRRLERLGIPTAAVGHQPFVDKALERRDARHVRLPDDPDPTPGAAPSRRRTPCPGGTALPGIVSRLVAPLAGARARTSASIATASPPSRATLRRTFSAHSTSRPASAGTTSSGVKRRRCPSGHPYPWSGLSCRDRARTVSRRVRRRPRRQRARRGAPPPGVAGTTRRRGRTSEWTGGSRRRRRAPSRRRRRAPSRPRRRALPPGARPSRARPTRSRLPHAPTVLGEPDGVSPLAAANVERTSRREACHLCGKAAIRLGAPEQHRLCVAIVPVLPAESRPYRSRRALVLGHRATIRAPRLPTRQGNVRRRRIRVQTIEEWSNEILCRIGLHRWTFNTELLDESGQHVPMRSSTRAAGGQDAFGTPTGVSSIVRRTASPRVPGRMPRSASPENEDAP